VARAAENIIARWFPVARGEEVISRHVVQTQLLGQEIAVWRDDAGSVNAWENRCPHRGVRLSIGFNTGTELRCQYHGWRYATGSGQCTFIPAHPTQKPSSAIRANVYGSIEQYGFVWVRLGQRPADALVPPTAATPPAFATLPTLATLPALATPVDRQATSLRSIFVEAPASTVAEALLRGYRFSADPSHPEGSPGEDSMSAAAVVAHDAFILTADAGRHDADASVTFLLQPMTESQTVIHGLLYAKGPGTERLTMLRHHNSQMTALRDAVEGARRANPGKPAAAEDS
jgi:nitrite reductase/ring-hydroxylating ferredoxin subunit